MRTQCDAKHQKAKKKPPPPPPLARAAHTFTNTHCVIHVVLAMIGAACCTPCSYAVFFFCQCAARYSPPAPLNLFAQGCVYSGCGNVLKLRGEWNGSHSVNKPLLRTHPHPLAHCGARYLLTRGVHRLEVPQHEEGAHAALRSRYKTTAVRKPGNLLKKSFGTVRGVIRSNTGEVELVSAGCSNMGARVLICALTHTHTHTHTHSLIHSLTYLFCRHS